MRKEKAFAFDFDGVILDSLSALRETYLEFLKLHGKTGSATEFNSLNGPSLSEIITKLKENYNLEDPHEVLFHEYKVLLHKSYLDAPLIDGVFEFLHLLSGRRIPIALVTSSLRDEVEVILRKHNLHTTFEYIVTGNDVQTSKPAPEIYLKLLDKFPQYQWFAIEDSENGLKSAINAGLQTIFFDPFGVGTAQKVLSRVSSMCCLAKRIEELKFNCCVVDEINRISIEILSAVPQYLTQDTINKIDEIWDDSKKSRSLNDDTVLYYFGHQTISQKCLIFAFWGPYRYFYAKRFDPSLHIPVSPLAVSGICIKGNSQVLLGKRKEVTEYGDCFELVPSGGLTDEYAVKNTVNYLDQLLNEYWEETGLNKYSISSMKTLGLVVDLAHSVFDVCCLISVRPSFGQSFPNNTEYSGLEWINIEDPRINLAIPTSRALLNLFKNGSKHFS